MHWTVALAYVNSIRSQVSTHVYVPVNRVISVAVYVCKYLSRLLRPSIAGCHLQVVSSVDSAAPFKSRSTTVVYTRIELIGS